MCYVFYRWTNLLFQKSKRIKITKANLQRGAGQLLCFLWKMKSVDLWRLLNFSRCEATSFSFGLLLRAYFLHISLACVCCEINTTCTIWQEKHVNLVHIESRKSKRRNSEFEIFVDCDSNREQLHEIIQLLRKHVNVLEMDAHDNRLPEESGMN